MDNKITKKRLSDFLSYEWIFMIIIAVVAILGWELIYHVSSVQLTAGQSFKYYYDETILSVSNSKLVNELLDRDTFSYDVLKLNTEMLDETSNVLASRLSIQEGDVIFTDIKGLGKTQNINGKEYPVTVRAKAHVDSTSYKMYAFDDMLEDAKKYLKDNFIKDGQEIDVLNVDDEKLESVFRERMKQDNRFRKESEIINGIKQEKARVVKLIENVKFFESFIFNPLNESALFKYTRYEQLYNLSKTDEAKDQYKDWMKGEKEKIYGINIGVLDEMGDGVDATKILQLREPENKEDNLSKNIVLMAFDFKSYQPHLQYESLSFVCSTMQMLLGTN